MTFLNNPSGLSPAAFKSYVATCRWPVWKPKFIVLHNTAEPNLKQWAYANDGKDHEYQRILNLNRYYKSLGWHSGPHLFISPNLIWVACDFAADGVHASCYNAESLGVEMVGDYSDEAFDSGDGGNVRDLTVAALAILHQALGIDPATLRFHKECLRDHHDCPGKNVVKADLIARIRAAMAPVPVATSKILAPAAHVEAVTATAGSSASGSAPAQPLEEKPAPTYDQRAATIYQFWIANGFTPAQACGLLAQADAESALDPKAVGDHGQAFGLDQWHQARIDAIRNGCGVDLRALPTLEDQLNAALWELQHTEKMAAAKIRAATTAFDAGHDAARFWERPASTAQYAKRGSTAEKWAVHFGKYPV